MEVGEYPEAFRLKQSTYMHYPSHVHIETVGACNARCAFCPNGVMDRRGERMSDELFEKIVQDLKQFPQEIPLAISPSKVNEPLLDKKIFSRMDALAKELPHATFWFTTNLSLANRSVIARLSKVSRLGYIWISLHSLQEEEYRQWTGLSLHRTVQNVKHLLHLNREKQFTPTIFLGRVKDGSPGDEQFIEDTRTVFAEFDKTTDYHAAVMRRGQWMGFTESRETEVPQWPCGRWFEFSITCTGQVAFCCMDGLCKHPLGDMNQQSIFEIYNQPECLKRRLNGPARNDVELCRGCNFL